MDLRGSHKACDFLLVAFEVLGETGKKGSLAFRTSVDLFLMQINSRIVLYKLFYKC
jgi:hypothetical protein